MKHARYLIAFLAWAIFPQHAFPQIELSTVEILKEFSRIRTSTAIDSVFRLDIHAGTRVFLDELLNKDVDTVIVFAINYPGYVYYSHTSTTIYPYQVSFLWKDRGQYFCRMSECVFTQADCEASGMLIEFAAENFQKIKEEFFMASVSRGVISNGNLRLTVSIVSHEPKYEILVLMNQRYNYLAFSENAITNRTNLFLDYNRSLTSFQLYVLLSGLCGNDHRH